MGGKRDVVREGTVEQQWKILERCVCVWSETTEEILSSTVEV